MRGGKFLIKDYGSGIRHTGRYGGTLLAYGKVSVEMKPPNCRKNSTNSTSIGLYHLFLNYGLQRCHIHDAKNIGHSSVSVLRELQHFRLEALENFVIHCKSVADTSSIWRIAVYRV